MKKIFLFVFSVFSVGIIAQNKILTGNEANSFLKGSDQLRIEEGSNAPSFVRFREEVQINEAVLFDLFQTDLGMNQEYEFVLSNSSVDQLGITHNRYKQFYQQREVAYSNLMIHQKEGKVISFNGVYQTEPPSNNISSLTEEQALNIALAFVNANQYMWEIEFPSNPTSSEYYPKGDLVLLPTYFKAVFSIDIVYRFNIYAYEPFGRQSVFVDANTGEIAFNESLIHTGGDSPGKAVTGYSDTQDITTDSISNYFILVDSTRGNSIETYDCQRARNFNSAVHFVDSNNFWDNSNGNLDQYAGDAHWATSATYDYLSNVHNRNSIDDNGFTLKSYVHFDNNLVNAFWDGQRMSYGDGNQMNSPLTTLDIVAHEITHGLTDFTSDLIYANESGALNESFSDIFGAALEFYARPSRANWGIGEDIGGAFRSMSNPKQNGDPDTYDGLNWIDQNCFPTAGNDRCGVHTNSGVQNHWFYLLATGSTGINDRSDTFNVQGLGMLKAEKIAFRNLTIYLSPSSNYEEARFFSIVSAIDLYGACSPEVESTTNAWYAVGVGKEYESGVSGEFDAVQDKTFCYFPVNLDFESDASNVINFSWDFGNGMTSSSRNPSTVYNNPGQYTVRLIADGGTCGIDTITKTNYISINTNNTCSYVLRDTTNAMLTACAGRLFDSGGFGDEYGTNEEGTVTIHVPSADFIQLDFVKLAIEAGIGFNCNRDYIEVFDGSTINDPLIGRYCSNYPPPNNRIFSSSNYVTLRMYSDAIATADGFQIDWLCRSSVSPPIVDFVANTDTTCDGLISFTNLTQGGVDNAYWDLGDRTTSFKQNPIHEYKTNGTYSVRLIVQNSFGRDTVTKLDYITVNRPSAPSVSMDTFCIGEDAGLKVFTNQNVEWYRDTTSTPILLIDSLTLFNVRKDTSFFVREISNPATLIGGKLSNSGTGEYSSDNDYIEFDVHKRILLKTMILFSNKAGIRKLDLWNSNGELVQSKDIYIPASPLRVNVNMVIDPNTNYRLAFSSRDISLYKNTSGAAFPYVISNLVTLKNANTSGEYPYFYQWRVSELPCISSFMEIKATIDTSCTLVGIDESSNSIASLVEVFPNPFNNQLVIRLERLKNKENTSISLFSTTGVLVFRKEYHTIPEIINLELNDLAAGAYYLSLSNKDYHLSKKVVKVN